MENSRKTCSSLFYSAVFSLCVFTYTSVFVSAHSASVSFEKEAPPYLIDIGYDSVAPIAGEHGRFDFSLRHLNTKDPAEFSEVWVRVLRGEKTFLATGIQKQEIGPTTLLFVFPREGSYTLEASYRSAGGGEIAKAAFSIPVLPTEESFWSLYSAYAIFFLAGILLGGAGAFIFRRNLAANILRLRK